MTRMRLQDRKRTGSAFFGIALGLFMVGPASPVCRAQPNVVLVMADDQGWGDVAYNGHAALQTPHLDAMAAAGLRLDRFYAAAPVCSPTRGSVMTGRHPNRFGCFSWGHTLRPQEITLAEAFKPAGYRTGHFGKWHLGSVRHGSPVNPGASGFDEWFSAPNFFDNDPVMSREGTAVRTQGESSMVTMDAAIGFIRQQVAASRKFLAVVWFGSPHLPHEALPADRETYADQPEALQHFYGEITAMDRAVGKLRAELRALGVQDNTLLWYCSDNGALPKVGTSGGHRGNKGELYEGGLLVPAILEWPDRMREPRASSVRCNTSDIVPTLLEVAGIELQRTVKLDGISLLPLIENRMKARPQAMGFWHHPTPGIRTPSKAWMAELLAAQEAGSEPADLSKLRLDAGQIRQRYPETVFPGHAAWIEGDWKLHRIADAKGGGVRYELYDLGRDPGETRDLAGQGGTRQTAMAEALETWQRSVVRSLNGQEERLPTVLILGDSISIGYTPIVKAELKGVADVIRPRLPDGRPENCAGTTLGVEELDRWLELGDGRWDVIHFNFGLHDLKHVDPVTGANSNDPAHPRQAEPGVYEKQLRDIVTRLRKTGATLIFATTTPVPPGGVKPYRDVTDPDRYNAIARRVMRENGVRINDLNAQVAGGLERFQQPVNVHFTPAGSRLLGQAAAQSIRGALH